MNMKKRHAEAYLGRYLNEHSEHPDMRGLTRAQRGVWTSGDLRVREEGELTNVGVDFGRNHMRYSYAPVFQENATFLTELPRTIDEEPWRYSVLTGAVIENSQTGARLDIADKVPEGWSVFVDFGEGASDCTVVDEHCIITVPNFGNKFYCMTLAHEVGHAWDCTTHPGLYAHKKKENAASFYARRLERERNADAFALHLLKPFLSTDPDDSFSVDCFRTHSADCRQSYMDSIHEQETTRLLKEAIAARIGRVAATE